MRETERLELQQFLDELEETILNYFKDRDGQPLKLAGYQLKFVKAIVERIKTRFIFLAATQAGKSEALACAIALLAIYFPNERIVNVSYTDEQAKIIFERVKAHLMNDSDYVRSLVDLDRSFTKAKEFSKSRMFLKNGTEIRVLSTGKGETESVGESLLGFEATALIVDEAGSIPDKIYQTKVLRMIGAKRSVGEEKMLILSGTPHKPGHFERAWNDPLYEKFHVDWRMAVEAGRMSIDTVNEQRANMTSTDFEAWYEAKFPSMTEDSMYDMKDVERNIHVEDLNFYGTKILSVDIGRYGPDFTIYTQWDYIDDIFRQVAINKDDDKSTMQVSGRIINLSRNNPKFFDRIIIDEGGLGGGVLDRVKELGYPAFGVIGGQKCTDEKTAKNCLNLKAQLHAEAARRFKQDKIKILNNSELKGQLRLIKRDFQSDGKLRIIDPEKSPDFVDSMVYGLYKPSSGTFFVINTETEESMRRFE